MITALIKREYGAVSKIPVVFDKDTKCPNCGHVGLYVEDDTGDYYMGSEYICTECKHTGHIIAWSEAKDITIVGK